MKLRPGIAILAALLASATVPVIAAPAANALVIAQNTTVNTLDPHNTASVATDRPGRYAKQLARDLQAPEKHL